MENTPFNLYDLNATVQNPSGEVYQTPSWIVSQLIYSPNEAKFQIVVLFNQEGKESFESLIDVIFSSNPELIPTVEFIEGQIIQLSSFTQSTLKI